MNTTFSMRILQSLCEYYIIYGNIPISMWILQFLCECYDLYVNTTISMWILRSLCGHYNHYVNTTITMWILQSLCEYYDRRSVCEYYNLYVDTTISMWILRSLWFPLSEVFERRKLFYRQINEKVFYEVTSGRQIVKTNDVIGRGKVKSWVGAKFNEFSVDRNHHQSGSPQHVYWLDAWFH